MLISQVKVRVSQAQENWGIAALQKGYLSQNESFVTFSCVTSNWGVSYPRFGPLSFYSLQTHTYTHIRPFGLFSSSFCTLLSTFAAVLGLLILPSPLPGTHRVCVLGGRLGMRWISLQVTLKSSSWWHSQGGDGHPFPPRVLGRARSSARSSRGVGFIFQGSQGYFFILHNLLGPLRPGVLAGWRTEGAWEERGLTVVVTSAPKRRLERGKEVALKCSVSLGNSPPKQT